MDLDKIDQEKNRLIELISRQSDFYGNKLVDFMDTYHLNNLQSATVAQLQEYVAIHCRQQLTPERSL